MSNVTETYEHAGLTVKIGWDDWAEPFNPRDDCNLGTMVCWHPDYVLGDEQITDGDGRGAVHRDHNGSASTLFQTEHGRTDFRSMETIERYLRIGRRAVVVMPLYLLDHSGISMSVGSNTVGRGDTAIPGGGRDSWGNSRGWDTTMVGFIYTTAERVAELCGECLHCRGTGESERCVTDSGDYDPAPCERCGGSKLYAPPDYDGDPLTWVAEQLRIEVRYYDAWLRGSVYWYAVQDADGDVLESCGGFLIATDEDEKWLREEANSAAEAEAAAIAQTAREWNVARTIGMAQRAGSRA